jgi:hypothetical protein
METPIRECIGSIQPRGHLPVQPLELTFRRAAATLADQSAGGWMRLGLMKSLRVIAASSLVAWAFFASVPTRAAGGPVRVAQASKAADEQTFKEFEGIVADFSVPEKIQAWDAFLQKYPNNSYAPKVREIVAGLKGEKKPAPVATPTAAASTNPVTSDPDLDFLNDGRAATPTPRPVATARPIVPLPTPTPTPFVAAPRPTPRPTATPNAFMDSSVANKDPHGSAGDRVSWNDAGTGSSGPATGTSGADGFSGSRSNGSARPPRIPPRPKNFGRESRNVWTEVAAFGGFAPDETYVRNVLAGGAVTLRFGRTWAIAVEGAGAQHSETPLLRSLRNLDAAPEVISKYNFIAGAVLQANMLSALDPMGGGLDGRNDLYVLGGGGIVDTNLEICKQTGGVKCASPLFINGVNFTYLTAGVGHRFYVTDWLLVRSEIRGRIVFELIDGAMSPRANVQINFGPSVLF